MISLRQLAGDGLSELPTHGRHQNDIRSFRRQTLDSFKERFGFQDHAWPAAERSIIDGLVPIMRPIPQVVNAQIERTLLPRPADHADVQRSHQHLGKQREHVNSHARTPIGSICGPIFNNLQRAAMALLGRARLQ